MTRTIKAMALGSALMLGGALFVPMAGAAEPAYDAGAPMATASFEASNAAFNAEAENVSFNAELSGIGANPELSGTCDNLVASNVSYSIELGEITTAAGQTCA